MADEPTPSGWLPPRAPGARPAPRFDMVADEHVPVAPPAGVPAPAAPGPPAPTLRRGTPPRPAGLAVASVLLGVVGLALLVLTLGLGFAFALPCSIAAWICGAQARTRIDLGELRGGRGQAHAGYLLGIAGVVIGVAAAVGWVIWLVNGGDLEELRRDLERYRDAQAGEALVRAVVALLG